MLGVGLELGSGSETQLGSTQSAVSAADVWMSYVESEGLAICSCGKLEDILDTRSSRSRRRAITFGMSAREKVRPMGWRF